MSQILGQNFIQLDGQRYKLAVGENANRSWQERRVPVATERVARPDVQEGTAPNEFVITWNDWSKGVCGEYENLPGCLWKADNVNPTIPGELHSVAEASVITEGTDAAGSDNTIWIEFQNIMYLISGKWLHKFVSSGGYTDALDFGQVVTDAIVVNDLLVVCFGGSQVIWSYDGVSSISVDSNWEKSADVHADYFAKVEDMLWRSYNTNEVFSALITDAPTLLASWSNSLTIGDDDIAITDLNGYGEKLAVSKEDGLYLGDSAALFPNVFPQMEYATNSDNGGNTLIRGGDIFYPYRDGLLRYNNGIVEEVGLQQVIPDAPQVSDTSSGYKISALAHQGEYIWAATKPSYFSRANAHVLKTTNGGGNYSNVTAGMGDNDVTSVLTISGLDDVAAGDWILLGHEDDKFYGAMFLMDSPNTTTSRILQLAYWNGAAWASLTSTSAPLVDDTTVGTTTLAQSGIITSNHLPGDWAKSSLETINAYWMRIGVADGDLSGNVVVSEIRIITGEPLSYIYRGRSSGAGDIRDQSIIWEPYFSSINATLSVPAPTGLMVSQYWPNRMGSSLLIANRQHVTAHELPFSPIEQPLDYMVGQAYFAKHDGGMPNENKQILDFTLNGRSIDAQHGVDLNYRVDDDTSFTQVGSGITSVPSRNALTGITGYSIQPMLDFQTPTIIQSPPTGNDMPTVVNSLECRFRVLPTFKTQYQAQIIIEDGVEYGVAPPDIQLSNLEGDHGAGTITLIDPLSRSKSVTLDQIEVVEILQENREHPALAAKLVMTEV